MAYSHIPVSNMAVGIGGAIGSLQASVLANVRSKLLSMAGELARQACPSDGRLNQLSNTTGNLSNSLGSISSRLSRFAAIPRALRGPVSGLEAAIRIILAIPIPQSLPPGFGIPVNITNKFNDIRVLLKEFIQQIKELIDSILAALAIPTALVGGLQGLVPRMNLPILNCRVNNALERALESGAVTAQQLQEQGLHDGTRITLSDLNRAFVGNDVNAQVNGQRGFTLSDEGQRLLREGRLRGAYDAQNEDQRRSDATNTLLGAINSLDNLTNNSGGAGSTGGANLGDLRQELQDTLNQFQQPAADDPVLDDYTSESGEVYSFEIIDDPNSPAIAPRRYAVGTGTTSGIRVTGPPSFSSDTQVLIEEVKFRIENNLP